MKFVLIATFCAIWLVCFTLTVRADSQEKVLLKDVTALTFYDGRWTNGRRSQGVQQLKCIKGDETHRPMRVQCTQTGWDGKDAQWACEAQLDDGYDLGRIEVVCEGYDYPDDPYILTGSCGLEYELIGHVKPTICLNANDPCNPDDLCDGRSAFCPPHPLPKPEREEPKHDNTIYTFLREGLKYFYALAGLLLFVIVIVTCASHPTDRPEHAVANQESGGGFFSHALAAGVGWTARSMMSQNSGSHGHTSNSSSSSSSSSSRPSTTTQHTSRSFGGTRRR